MVVKPLDLHLTPEQKNFYHFLGMTSGAIIVVGAAGLAIKCYFDRKKREQEKLESLGAQRSFRGVGLAQTEVRTSAIAEAECAAEVPQLNSPVGGSKLVIQDRSAMYADKSTNEFQVAVYDDL